MAHALEPGAFVLRDWRPRPLAEHLLFGDLQHGGHVRVERDGDGLKLVVRAAAPEPRTRVDA